MVSDQCISTIDQILQELELATQTIELGMVHLEKKPTFKQVQHFHNRIKEHGYEIISHHRKNQVELIKSIIDEHIHALEDGNFIFSEILTAKLNKEYSQISRLFSKIENKTVEQYVIIKKLEKVKHLVEHSNLSFSEISYKLGYSSVSHLSTQFKKLTGVTPSMYKNTIKEQKKATANALI
jgi:AraC family transcriptional regulator